MKIKKNQVFVSFILSLLLTTFPLFCYANNSTKKLIALTFDDGPHIQYTEEVLNILKKNNIKATFFVIGGNVKNHPELLKKTFVDGNLIGNHSYTHPNLSKIDSNLITKELNRANDIIYKTIHVYPTLMRPPYGACDTHCDKVANTLGFKKINWDYLVNDWDVNKTTAGIIATNIIKHAGPGKILSMHDGGGNREKTVKALPSIIATLKKEGYQFVTVAELLNTKPYRKN